VTAHLQLNILLLLLLLLNKIISSMALITLWSYGSWHRAVLLQPTFRDETAAPIVNDPYTESNRKYNKVKLVVSNRQKRDKTGYRPGVNKVFAIFQYISNKMQRYSVYFNWKLLYMFRVVPSPNIRSANNCIYSIWYLSNRYCYLPLSWKSWKDSSNAVTNTRCCRCSCLRSLWWVEVPPETCRAVSR